MALAGDVVFVGKGKASIVLALTKGDTSPRAVAAVRYAVTAR